MANFNFTSRDLAGASMPGRRFYKEYKTWQRIIAKCHNVNHARYENYGGRGFVFNDFYRYSFLNFMNEVGECPEPKARFTIERIDNDRGYETGNMKWLVSEMQAINKTTNRIIEHEGKKKPLAVWCKDLGLNYTTVSSRMRRGLTFDKAIMETPPKICGEIIYKGEIMTINGFCSLLKLNFDMVCAQYSAGKTGDEIAESPASYQIREVKKYTYNGESLSIPQWAERFGLNKSTLRDKLKRYSFEFLCEKYLENREA